MKTEQLVQNRNVITTSLKLSEIIVVCFLLDLYFRPCYFRPCAFLFLSIIHDSSFTHCYSSYHSQSWSCHPHKFSGTGDVDGGILQVVSSTDKHQEDTFRKVMKPYCKPW